MDWTALLKAFGLCFISIVIEAISYTKEGKAWFENLKRPKYSFSLWVWYFVGALYYILFGVIAYRLFSNGQDILSLPVMLIALVMILNGLSNFVIFKYHSLKWFYLIIYPFAFLLLVLIVVLSNTDRVSSGLASIYFVWLIYDLYYGYHMWKLNDTKNNGVQ